MMSFGLTFRRLLRKYLPQITEEDIDRHESLFALRFQLMHKLEHLRYEYDPDKKKQGSASAGEVKPEPNRPSDSVKSPAGQDDIGFITREAEAIFAPYRKEYNAVYQLSTARRQYAMEQGHFLQIPPSLPGLGRYLKTAVNYRVVQVKTMPRLWSNRVKHYFKAKLSVAQTAMAVPLVGFIIWLVIVLSPAKEAPEKPPSPDQSRVVPPDTVEYVQPSESDMVTDKH